MSAEVWVRAAKDGVCVERGDEDEGEDVVEDFRREGENRGRHCWGRMRERSTSL